MLNKLLIESLAQKLRVEEKQIAKDTAQISRLDAYLKQCTRERDSLDIKLNLLNEELDEKKRRDNSNLELKIDKYNQKIKRLRKKINMLDQHKHEIISKYNTYIDQINNGGDIKVPTEKAMPYNFLNNFLKFIGFNAFFLCVISPLIFEPEISLAFNYLWLLIAAPISGACILFHQPLINNENKLKKYLKKISKHKKFCQENMEKQILKKENYIAYVGEEHVIDENRGVLEVKDDIEKCYQQLNEVNASFYDKKAEKEMIISNRERSQKEARKLRKEIDFLRGSNTSLEFNSLVKPKVKSIGPRQVIRK